MKHLTHAAILIAAFTVLGIPAQEMREDMRLAWSLDEGPGTYIIFPNLDDPEDVPPEYFNKVTEAQHIENSIIMGDGRGEGLTFIALLPLDSSAELTETETKFFHVETFDEADDPSNPHADPANPDNLLLNPSQVIHRFLSFALHRVMVHSGFNDELDSFWDIQYGARGRVFLAFTGQAAALDNPADNRFLTNVWDPVTSSIISGEVQRLDHFIGIGGGAGISSVGLIGEDARFTANAMASAEAPYADQIPLFGTLTGIYGHAGYVDPWDSPSVGALGFGQVPRMVGGAFEAIPIMRIVDNIAGIPGSTDLAIGVQGHVAGSGWGLVPGMEGTTEANEQGYDIGRAMAGVFYVFGNGASDFPGANDASKIETAYGLYVGDPGWGYAIRGTTVDNAYGVYIESNSVPNAVQNWSLVAEGNVDMLSDVFVGGDVVLDGALADSADLHFAQGGAASEGDTDSRVVMNFYASGATTANRAVESRGSASTADARQVGLYNQCSWGPTNAPSVLGVAVATNSPGTADVEVVTNGIADMEVFGPINVGDPIAVDAGGRGVRFDPPDQQLPWRGGTIRQGMVQCVGHALQSNTSGQATIRVMVAPTFSVYIEDVDN